MTVEQYIETYTLHIDLENILRAVANDYVNRTGNILDITVALKTEAGSYGGNTTPITNDGKVIILIPDADHGGRAAITSINGLPTYLQYDEKVAQIHEIHHVILGMLGLDNLPDTELNIAVMAKAVSDAGSDLELFTRMMQGAAYGWSPAEKLAYANTGLYSFENIYNTRREDGRSFAEITGVSNLTDANRKGYGEIGTWIPGTGILENLRINGDIAYLGNQNANTIQVGKGNDYIDGGDGSDHLYGDGLDSYGEYEEDILNSSVGGKDTLIGGHGADILYGGGGNDTLWADKLYQHSDTSSDNLFGGYGNDTIYGSDGSNIIYGDNEDGSESSNVANFDELYGYGGSDVLIGGKGSDIIDGGSGDDFLFGATTNLTVDDNIQDYLLGGKDFDTYFAGNTDIIYDEDGIGVVKFEGTELTGGTLKAGTDNVYLGDGGEYTLNNEELTFTKNDHTVQILDYHKDRNDLGIKLDGGELKVTVYAPSVGEDIGRAPFAFVLTGGSIDKNVTIEFRTVDGTATSTGSNPGDIDFEAKTFTYDLSVNERYGTFDISILEDSFAEGEEGFSVEIVDIYETASPSNKIDFIQEVQTAIIYDTAQDDLKITVFAPTVKEEDGTAPFAIMLSRPVTEETVITLRSQDGTAIAGEDYTEYFQTLWTRMIQNSPLKTA
jgi:Ca2+-binding RTX toxin-like protein